MRSKTTVWNTQRFGFIALIVVIGFSMAACGDSSDSAGGNKTPVASDYTFGNLNQTLTEAGNNIIAVTIMANSGKSPGAVSNIRYNNSTTIPQTAETYAVTFDVAAATGWNAATGLSAGNLTVSGPPSEIPGMAWIPAETFTMGSPTDEPNRGSDETHHQVTLTGFYMGKYEVTQAQYEDVMGENPSFFTTSVPPETSTAKRPVECVTWYDAIEFCNKLSTKEGLTPVYTITGRTPAAGYPITGATVTANWSTSGYRLPTEAQWEYACRAATTSPFNTGNNITTDQANYDGNYPYNNNPKGTYLDRTTEVGSFAANAWGLYDMHGNVREWCWDWYGSDYYSSSPAQDPTGAVSNIQRVQRGGSWDSLGHYLRSAYRGHSFPNSTSDDLGFRLVRP
jgi:formylglycine-generating enzyme required for sulfatase activity